MSALDLKTSVIDSDALNNVTQRHRLNQLPTSGQEDIEKPFTLLLNTPPLVSSTSTTEFYKHRKWKFDAVAHTCDLCDVKFGIFTRKHHCK